MECELVTINTRAGLAVESGQTLRAYPIEHYPHWQTLRAQAGVAAWGDSARPGLLGEDLTLKGLLETQAWVGDVLRAPEFSLLIEGPGEVDDVAALLGFPQAAAMMRQSAWCGFKLRVLTPGMMRAGARLTLVAGARVLGVNEQYRMAR